MRPVILLATATILASCTRDATPKPPESAGNKATVACPDSIDPSPYLDWLTVLSETGYPDHAVRHIARSQRGWVQRFTKNTGPLLTKLVDLSEEPDGTILLRVWGMPEKRTPGLDLEGEFWVKVDQNGKVTVVRDLPD